MVQLTHDQRRALLRVYQRDRIRLIMQYGKLLPNPYGWSYRAFRRSVCSTFGCDGAVTVFWCGMWLCIERDGYVHS